MALILIYFLKQKCRGTKLSCTDKTRTCIYYGFLTKLYKRP